MRTVRYLGKLSVAALVLLVGAIVAIQYQKVIVRNWQLAHAVASARSDVEALREKERRQRKRIERLTDPQGAIPEIHDRLHLVSPHEELIYVKSAPSAAPGAASKRTP